MRSGNTAGVLFGLVFCSTASADDGPLDRLIASEGGSVCFSRQYDAAHLKRHPGQATRSAMLSFKADAVRVMLDQKGHKEPLYIVAGCEWNPRANRDTSGNRLLPSFTKTAAYDCIVIVAPSSAEEGGYAILDPASDGKSLMLHIDTPVSVRPGLGPDARPFPLTLGRLDRVFRLDRADKSLCKELEDRLEGP